MNPKWNAIRNIKIFINYKYSAYPIITSSNYTSFQYRILLIILLTILFDNSIAQKATINDSIKENSRKINIIIQQIYKKNDSLSRELLYYKAKEDYFVNAVDRQGSHFEFLMGVLLTIAGLISWTFFNSIIKKHIGIISDNIEKYSKGNNDKFNSINDLVRNLIINIAQSDFSLAYLYLNNGSPVQAIGQMFNLINRVAQTHKHLRSYNESGFVREIVDYIAHTEGILSQCQKNIDDHSKIEDIRRNAIAIIVDDPFKNVLSLNEPEINEAVFSFYKKYNVYLQTTRKIIS